MKKILLFALALGVGFSTYAQKNMKAIQLTQPKGFTQKSVADPNTYTPSINKIKHQVNQTVANKSTLNKTEIGSSGNLLTVQFSDIRCLSALPDLGVACFTHRSGGSWGGTVNQQSAAFTTDEGATFNNFILTSDQATWANRYPGGVLVNKTGNTTPNNAFVAWGGPYHVGGDWTGHYLASERLDSTLDAITYLPWEFIDFDPASVTISNMNSCNDQYVHGLAMYLDITASGSYYVNKYAEMINGHMVADSIVWDTVHFRPSIMHHSTDVDGVQIFSWGQAWSEDGNTGYAYFFGVDSVTNYNMSVQPIVYKSTDKGNTWVKQPVFDFSTISAIADSIWPTLANQTIYVPAIFGSEQSGTVDANGNLHIVTIVQGQYSTHEDSLGYTYVYEPRKLYDLYTTSTGWDAKYITSILSASVTYQDAEAIPSSTGGNSIGYDHRLHVARTVDGTKLFAVWNDVVDTVSTPRVSLPDIFGYGWDINTGDDTPVKNFTALTAYDGDNYWMYVGDRVFVDGSNFEIPVTTSVNGSDDAQPLTHYYVSGIFFTNDDFVGIEETESNISNVSQNYPNPFNGNTEITVNLNQNSNVSLYVTNLLGQKVYESNKGNMSAGSHVITFNGSDLTSGIYFYTVKANESTITHKMIVE